jgi:branched-chain amino acid transport system permease protein
MTSSAPQHLSEEVADPAPAPVRSPRRSLRPGVPTAVAMLTTVVLLGWIVASPDVAQLKIVSTTLMYVALAGAWNLLGGYVGYINFGTAMFTGLGAYTTAILATNTHVQPLLLFPAAVVVACAGALLIGVPGFRLRGDYFAVATFVLTLALQQLANVLPVTGGAGGLLIESPFGSLDQSVRIHCLLFLAVAVLATGACWFVERARWMSAMVAVREDEDAAAVLGIPTLRIKVVAFVAGAAIAGLVGCLYASELMYIEPIGTFDFHLSLAVVVAAVVGGKGTWYGPALGAVLTQMVLQQLLVNVDGTWSQFIFGAVLLVAILIAPRGIAGLFTTRRGRRFGV